MQACRSLLHLSSSADVFFNYNQIKYITIDGTYEYSSEMCQIVPVQIDRCCVVFIRLMQIRIVFSFFIAMFKGNTCTNQNDTSVENDLALPFK